MSSGLALLWERLRTSYWLIPALIVAAAVGLAFALPEIDERLDTVDLLGFIFTGSTGGARGLLGAIATAVLGVAGTTFSITIAVLTLTSSQFGPRLLRHFMRDRGSQLVLGVFLGTFVYALLVMRTIRDEDGAEFVPNLAVTTAVLLAVASVALLVYFIHHIAASIQASRVIALVASELSTAIDRLYPTHVGAAPANPRDWSWPRGELPTTVLATGSGYLQGVNGESLLEIADREHRVIELLHRPGDFVAERTPLFRVGGVPPDESLAREIRSALSLGERPSPAQDVGFPLQQLAEIAVRALSSGINDPGTAVMCIDRLGAALGVLAGREFPSPLRESDEGRVRVIAPRPDFADLLGLAFDQIRRYGRGDAEVMQRLVTVLGQIGACASGPARRDATRAQLRLALAAGLEALPAEEARQRLRIAHARAGAAIDPRDPPS